MKKSLILERIPKSRHTKSSSDSTSSGESSSDEGHKKASQKLCRSRKSRRTKSLSDGTSSQESSSDEGHKRASQKHCRSVSLKSRSHSTHHRYGNREQMSTKEMTCSKKITESYISKPGPSFNVDSDFAGYPASREMKRQWIKEFSKFNSESATYTERDAFTHGNFNESDSNSEGENDMLHRSHRYSPKIKSRIQKQHSSYNMASISSSDHKSYASNSVSENSYTYKSSVIMEMEKKSSKSNYERYRSRSPRSHSEDRSNSYISKPGPSFNVDSDFAGYPASREMKRQWIKEFSKFNSESATYTERDAFTHGNFNESDSNSEGENDMLHRSHRYSPKIKSRIQKHHSSYNMASISSSDHKSYASNFVSENSYTYKSSVIMEMEKKSSKSNYERYRSRSPRSHSEDRSNRYRTSSSCHCSYGTLCSRRNSYATSYSHRTSYASSHQNYKHTHKD